ncbi:hypothetical protein [Nocardia carnea]|uniref:hypothetical protein n=1 Tax=Nocardia carnea TaxID=37328 RepID=UPI0024571537|nr:hypothetical protein [Nocardia carnea]
MAEVVASVGGWRQARVTGETVFRDMPHKVHRTALVLASPVTLAITFDTRHRP